MLQPVTIFYATATVVTGCNICYWQQFLLLAVIGCKICYWLQHLLRNALILSIPLCQMDVI